MSKIFKFLKDNFYLDKKVEDTFKELNDINQLDLEDPSHPDFKSPHNNIPIPFNVLEPKITNRYIIRFPDNFDINIYMCKSISRPSFHINQGSILYNDIVLNLYDPINPSTSQKIFSIVNDNTITNFDFIIEILDPVGVTIEKWTINGFIRSVDFGKLDYSLKDLLNITMTIGVNTVTLNY